MAKYYFDTRDGDILVQDHEGLSFQDLPSVRVEAARILAELAIDLLPEGMQRTLAVEVRNEANTPILRCVLIYDVQDLAQSNKR